MRGLQAHNPLVVEYLQGLVGYKDAEELTDRQTDRQTGRQTGGILTLYRALAKVLMVADKGFLFV